MFGASDEVNGVYIGSDVSEHHRFYFFFYIISFNERHNFKLISFNEAQVTLATFKLIIYLPVCGLQEGVSSFRSYPAGLRDVINYTKHRYNNPPIYITETGTRQCFNSGLSIISSLKNMDLIITHNNMNFE